MLSITNFYIFLAALFTTLILVPLSARLAVKFGGMDQADERKIHTQDIPRLGGAAIFFGFLLALMIFEVPDRQGNGFLAGALIVFLIGLADDLISLAPMQKLAGTALAVFVGARTGGVSLASLGDPFATGEIDLGILSLPFTILAVTGVINAINLLDGLDGLAAGFSAIAATAFGYLAYETGNLPLLGMCAALLGSTIGFLKFNSYPARIFMGDSGSLFLGYCLGFFSLMLVQGSNRSISELTPLLILAIPIYDTLFVMYRRWRMGHRLFSPDRRHLHHRLLDMGIGHNATVIVVYGFAYLLCAVAIVSHNLPDPWLALIVIATPLLLYALLRYLVHLSVQRNISAIRSERPFRLTHSYRRLVNFSRQLVVVAKYLIIAILWLAFFLPTQPGSQLSIIAGLLFVLCLVLFFMTHDWGNRFLLFVIYGSGAFIVLAMENAGRGVSLAGFPLLSISDDIFFSLLALIGSKAFIHRRTGKLLNSPLECLLLFLVISVPMLPKHYVNELHLLTVAVKSVILFVSYKLVLIHQTHRNLKIIFSTLLALCAISIKGLLF